MEQGAVTMSSVKRTTTRPLNLERCLQLWGAWERGYRSGPQQVRVAIWTRDAGSAARADATAIEYLTSSGRYIVQHVSKGIEALPRREWQLILEVVYVWNGEAPKVFRSNRLPSEVSILAGMLEDAKVALAPILQGRGLDV